MYLNLSKLREDYKQVKSKNYEVAQRLSALIELEKINLTCRGDCTQAGKRMKVMALCQGLEVSLRTLQRWRSGYIKKGLFGIAKRKAKGAKKKEISNEAKKHIELMRKDYLWGAEVIQAHLRYDHSIKLSRYRIDKYLTDSGLKQQYPCLPVKKYKSSKKHNKVVVVNVPGAHTQMDVNHQPHLLNHKSYVYNFVDHSSNWSFKRSYKSASPTSTIDFMKRLLDVCPFEIKRLQTDNGVEFTYKYISKFQDDPKEHPLTTFCKKHKIQHKLIPPGEKELQGLVERSHRQDKQELFHRVSSKDLESFNAELGHYYVFRNNRRRFKKLGWKTPTEWLDNFMICSLAICLMFDKGKKRKKRKNIEQKVTKKVKKLSTREEIRAVRRILSHQKEKKAA